MNYSHTFYVLRVYRTAANEHFLLEYSLIPEVLSYKQPMTKNGWWVNVPGVRRIRILNKRYFFTSYFMKALSTPLHAQAVFRWISTQAGK